MEPRGGGLDGLQTVAALPRWPDGASAEAQAVVAREEAAIRDRFTVYCYAFDNHDLETVMGFFADDCVVTNPRGTVSGPAAIRVNYRVLFGYWATMRQLWGNVLVRVRSADEAYLAAYHSAILVSDDQTLAGMGTDLWRLKKFDGDWKIVERWITDDVDHSISLYRGVVEDPEKVAELRRAAE